MKNDCASHTIPPPIIKQPGTAIEDAAGALRTCHSMLGLLATHIESMQDQSRGLGERHADIYVGQLDDDLARAWGLVDMIEMRLKDQIILIDAAVDAMPRGATS